MENHKASPQNRYEVQTAPGTAARTAEQALAALVLRRIRGAQA